MRKLFFIVLGFNLTSLLWAQQDTLIFNRADKTHPHLYEPGGRSESGLKTDILFKDIVKQNFNGIAIYVWQRINDTTKYVEGVHILDSLICVCSNGYVIRCEERVYNYAIGTSVDKFWMEKSAILEKGKPYWCAYYHESGVIASISIESLIDDHTYNQFTSFNERGDTIATGSYLDGENHGRWVWYYIGFGTNEKEFVETWENGVLVNIENTDVLFVDENGNLMSKRKFFKIIAKQPGCYMFALNEAQQQMVPGYAFLMGLPTNQFDISDPLVLNKLLQKFGS